MKFNKTVIVKWILWPLMFSVVFYAGIRIGQSEQGAEHSIGSANTQIEDVKSNVLSNQAAYGRSTIIQSRNINEEKVQLKTSSENQLETMSDITERPSSVDPDELFPPVHPDELLVDNMQHADQSDQNLDQERYAMEEAGIHEEDIEAMLERPEDDDYVPEQASEFNDISLEQQEDDLILSLTEAGAEPEEIEAMVSGLIYNHNEMLQEQNPAPVGDDMPPHVQ